MPPRRSRRLPTLLAGVVLLGLLALVLALVAGGGKGSSPPAAGGSAGSGSAGGGFEGAALPLGGLPAPDFSLREESGRTVTLSSLRGRPVVLAFLYPGCGPSCVLIAEQIRGALDDLGHPVPVVIVNAGPSPSPPAAVRRFLDEVSLSRRALFLDGPPGRLRRIWRQYRVVPGSAGRAAFATAAEVRLLDAQGRQRVVYGTEQLTPEALAHDIARLQGETSPGGG
ncbi:MAG TPA: SCO family protein [Solirubrobacteraceae bacterium]|nr:SCO family protein [Solirubrobacteraceae bacterium]